MKIITHNLPKENARFLFQQLFEHFNLKFWNDSFFDMKIIDIFEKKKK